MIDTNAIAQGFLPVTLRLETGEEILFILDTGSPLTLLDNSLKGNLESGSTVIPCEPGR